MLHAFEIQEDKFAYRRKAGKTIWFEILDNKSFPLHVGGQTSWVTSSSEPVSLAGAQNLMKPLLHKRQYFAQEPKTIILA